MPSQSQLARFHRRLMLCSCRIDCRVHHRPRYWHRVRVSPQTDGRWRSRACVTATRHPCPETPLGAVPVPSLPPSLPPSLLNTTPAHVQVQSQRGCFVLERVTDDAAVCGCVGVWCVAMPSPVPFASVGTSRVAGVPHHRYWCDWYQIVWHRLLCYGEFGWDGSLRTRLPAAAVTLTSCATTHRVTSSLARVA